MGYEWYVTPHEYEIAAQNGIKDYVVNKRIRGAAWTKEKALTTPTRPRKNYGDWIKIAELNGINSGTFRSRVNTHGWDMEKAATQPLLDRSENMKRVAESNRKYSKEMVALAVKNGIGYATFISRVYNGWKLDESITTPTMSRNMIPLILKNRYGLPMRKWRKPHEAQVPV